MLDGRPRTIVGVLRARLPDCRRSGWRRCAEAFVPIHMDAERVGWEGDHNNEAVGRLRAGVTADQARAELDVLQAQVSEIATEEAHEPVTLASVVTPLTETVVGRARRGLLLLLGAIAAVLLIACSNLANLSLTRAVGRLREAAHPIGARRQPLAARRPARSLEQLVLSVAGGALGLGVAWAALRLFVRTAPIDLPRVNEVALDARVLAFAAGVSILAGAVVAILPGLAQRRAATSSRRLRAGALTTTSDRGGTRRARRAAGAAGRAVADAPRRHRAARRQLRARDERRSRLRRRARALLVPLSMPAQPLRHRTVRVRPPTIACSPRCARFLASRARRRCRRCR